MIHGKFTVTVNIGVLASDSSWHFQDLKRACGAFRGEIELHSIDFASLAASLENEHDEQFFDQAGSVNSLVLWLSARCREDRCSRLSFGWMCYIDLRILVCGL